MISWFKRIMNEHAKSVSLLRDLNILKCIFLIQSYRDRLTTWQQRKSIGGNSS